MFSNHVNWTLDNGENTDCYSKPRDVEHLKGRIFAKYTKKALLLVGREAAIELFVEDSYLTGTLSSLPLLEMTN